MKFDKETLVKQKFWILLLVTLPLSLCGIFILATSVSGDISDTRKKIITDQKKYLKPPEVKTPKDIALARLEADMEDAKKTLVHKQAYLMQEPLFTWPQEVEDYFKFSTGLFAQKITVYRGKAEPPDSGKDDRLLVGKVVRNEGTYLLVEDKNKQQHKIYKSMRVDRHLPVEGEDAKDVVFGTIQMGDRVKVAFNRGKYFGEELTNDELNKYREPVEVYLKQIDPIIAQVEPMNERGEGVVQLKGPTGWFYSKEEVLTGNLPPRVFAAQKFFVCLEQGWREAAGNISEEVWLAQEDLWIQKEIYRLIRQANDSISRFDNADKGDNGEGLGKKRVFTSPLFKLTLWVTKDKADKDVLKMTFENLQSRRQRLDFKVRVKFNKDMDAQVFDIGSESVGPRHTATAERTVEKQIKDLQGWKGVYAVEQVLTWETAAVKRIDFVNIGSLAPDEYSHSHRTFVDNQVALKKLDLPPGATADAPIVRTPPPRFSGRNKNKLDTGANEITKHGLIRNRYWPPLNPISRRIPVSVGLIVDQDHVDRVLTSFNNSKLRFLTTQWLANRYTGTIRPALPDPADKAAGGPVNPRFRNIIQAPPTDEMETNVSLDIFGIVTLYERYPPPSP